MTPSSLWRRLTSSTTDTDLAQRKEAVLFNVLACFGVLSLLTQALQLEGLAAGRDPALLGWWLVNLGFFVGVAALLRAARRGRHRPAAAVLVGMITVISLSLALTDGTSSPMWTLLLGVAIVLSTILLGPGVAIWLASGGGSLAVVLAILFDAGVLHTWSGRAVDPGLGNVLGIAMLLVGLAIVCGIYTREQEIGIDEMLTRGAEESPLGQLRTKTLTMREIEVTRLVAEGLTNEEIARQLVLASGTVKTHVRNASRKCGCANRTALGVLAVREGLVPLKEGDDSATEPARVVGRPGAGPMLPAESA